MLDACDKPCLVVLHVIGGISGLEDVVAGFVADRRVVFTADAIDPVMAATPSFALPHGRYDKPVAYYQSARFLRLNGLLNAVKRPVFVCDIDLLLQRGVADLLERCADQDVVVNENESTRSLAARYTANLLLFNPTPAASRFLTFMETCLTRALNGREVTRYIDQAALVLAHRGLEMQGLGLKVGVFEAFDVNNVMYRSYVANPYRFLSLFHGFDMASLAHRETKTAQPGLGG